jgi:23S rRNA pseudouridine2605 synthase
MPRLNKYIASTGLCSRRKADELISDGKVSINGKVITELGFYVREKDKVSVDGKYIHPKNLEYYRFFKPAGYITTLDDEKGRKTIYDIIPPELKHLKPVGRLDKDSTGLLILTNDGELINQMTHPSLKVPKVYIVTINGRFTEAHAKEMSDGIEIISDTKEKKTAYAETLPIEISNNKSIIQVVLYQGINRQIRKMFAKLGFEVEVLKRTQHAIVTLEGLKKGQVKIMKPKLVKQLQAYLAKILKEQVQLGN